MKEIKNHRHTKKKYEMKYSPSKEQLKDMADYIIRNILKFKNRVKK